MSGDWEDEYDKYLDSEGPLHPGSVSMLRAALAEAEREGDEARALLKEAGAALKGLNLRPHAIVAAQGDELVLRISTSAIQAAAAALAKVEKQTP